MPSYKSLVPLGPGDARVDWNSRGPALADCIYRGIDGLGMLEGVGDSARIKAHMKDKVGVAVRMFVRDNIVDKVVESHVEFWGYALVGSHSNKYFLKMFHVKIMMDADNPPQGVKATSGQRQEPHFGWEMYVSHRHGHGHHHHHTKMDRKGIGHVYLPPVSDFHNSRLPGHDVYEREAGHYLDQWRTSRGRIDESIRKFRLGPRYHDREKVDRRIGYPESFRLLYPQPCFGDNAPEYEL